MSTYLFSYRTSPEPTPATPEAMAAWQAWFQDLGAGIVDPGNPVFSRRNVGNCDADTVLGGYTMVSADDLESAVAMTKGCPVLETGGGVEVGELTVLNPEDMSNTAGDQARSTGLAG
jgi:hypothetical protein